MATPPLPPGVYFNPSPEECVRDYLKPWVESGCDMTTPCLGGVFPVDVYMHRPSELTAMFPPGYARAFERKWYFLTPRESYGGPRKRQVATGGRWRVDQKTKELEAEEDDPAGGGKRRTYGFYLPNGSKTPWLMEEITADDDDDERGGVPAFCKIYVSPRTNTEERRAILGEDGVAVDADRKPKPARAWVHDEYFDFLAKKLPASCVRVHGAQVAAPPGVLGHHVGQQVAPPPGGFAHQAAGQVAPPPPGFIGHHNFQAAQPLPLEIIPAHQHGIRVGHLHELVAPEQPPAVNGLYEFQAEAPPDFLRDYYHGQNGGFDYLPAIYADPQKDEEEIHGDKKPRYASPQPCEAEAFDDVREQCCEAIVDAAVLQEPVPTPTLPQEGPGKASASPPAPVDDACQQAPKQTLSGGSMDLSNLTHESCVDDFVMACESQFLVA